MGQFTDSSGIDFPEQIVDAIQVNDGIIGDGVHFFEVVAAIANRWQPIINRAQWETMGSADERSEGIQTAGPIFQQGTIPERGGCRPSLKFGDNRLRQRLQRIRKRQGFDWKYGYIPATATAPLVTRNITAIFALDAA